MTQSNPNDSHSDSAENDTATDGRGYYDTEAEARAAGYCGAMNRNGKPCLLPAGWGTPGSASEGRCKFHGGCSTGPDDTAALEGNDYAVGNDGGAPENNANAEIHGGFSDWETAYERFDAATRADVERLMKCMRETAREHAPDVAEERRERLIREMATLMVLERRAAADTVCSPDGTGSGRGLIIEEEHEADGETYTRQKVNPALDAQLTHSKRQREIAKELRLWPGYQNQGQTQTNE